MLLNLMRSFASVHSSNFDAQVILHGCQYLRTIAELFLYYTHILYQTFVCFVATFNLHKTQYIGNQNFIW